MPVLDVRALIWNGLGSLAVVSSRRISAFVSLAATSLSAPLDKPSIHDRAHCTQGSLKRVVLGRKRTNGNAIAVGQWMEGQFVLNRAVVVEQLVELEFIRRHRRR